MTQIETPQTENSPAPFVPRTTRALPVPERRRASLEVVLDNVFFFLGAVAAGWLAYLVLSETFSRGLQYVWFLLVFWLLLAYLLLPRIHSMLTLIYV
ncbi:MAG: hypothetical protein JWR01_1260, partial [Subtercola sp.]|nr:hypothetical protein [Subtercola sp.]